MSPNAPAVRKYDPQLYFPKPTPGLSEIEPRWAEHGTHVALGAARIACPAGMQLFSSLAGSLSCHVQYLAAWAGITMCKASHQSSVMFPASPLQHGVEPGYPGGRVCAAAPRPPLQRHAQLPVGSGWVAGQGMPAAAVVFASQRGVQMGGTGHLLHMHTRALQAHLSHLTLCALQSSRLSAGISGVKVDCQAGVGLVGSRLGGGPRAALQVHTALEDSIAANFGDNHAINCMCHSTENIYRWRDTAVARASGGCCRLGCLEVWTVRTTPQTVPQAA